jgi:predicted PurR-regulated permease PerM
MQATSIEKNFFFTLLVLAIIFVLMIIYPFLTVVILAAAFAILLNPVYTWINLRVTRGISWLASLITVFLFLLVLCAPLFLIGAVVFNQAQNAYTSLLDSGSTSAFIHSIDASINSIMPNGFTFDTESKVSDLLSFLSTHVTGLFTSTLKTILLSALMVFTVFYLLKDGKQWKKNLLTLSPLSESNTREIFAKLTSAVNRIMKGSFFIAIAQGVLTGIGFAIFNVPNPALWGVAAGLASFIPTIGTSLISVPAMLFLYATGMQAQALGLLIWSGLLVGMIDNLLAPYVISKNTETPSLFILFSILGGVSLMGPVGVLIGPLALSLLYSLVSIYRKETGI